jgi:hypothetical protein
MNKECHAPEKNKAEAENPPKGALMVLYADRSMGIFKRIKAYAVFFGDQIVIAHLSKEREKSEGKAMLRAMKHKDQNLLQNVISRFNLWIYYGERYYDMNVQSLLNEDPANFLLRHDEVSEFIFKASQEDAEGDESGSWIGEMVIRAEGKETIDMSHNYRDSNQKIKDVLCDLYGGRLNYRESEVLYYPNRSYVYNNRRFY